MTVVVFDDDLIQIRLMETKLASVGLDLTDWRHCDQSSLPRGTEAIICDWLVPISWWEQKAALVNLAISSGLPSAIYTAVGIDEKALEIAYPNCPLEILQKDHNMNSMINWLKSKGIKSGRPKQVK